MNPKIRSFIEISLIILLFVLFSYIIQSNLDLFKSYIGSNLQGMLIYVLISIIAIVIAPISTMPMIPVASNLWGGFTAGVLSIIGWTIGSMIAFIIARKYGVKIVKWIIPIEKIARFEKSLPEENIFWTIVFLRMVIPVDILSYALGLFSKMKTNRYFFATLIGVTPFAFVFAYLGKLPIYYQGIAFAVAIIILGIGILIKKQYKRQ